MILVDTEDLSLKPHITLAYVDISHFLWPSTSPMLPSWSFHLDQDQWQQQHSRGNDCPTPLFQVDRLIFSIENNFHGLLFFFSTYFLASKISLRHTFRCSSPASFYLYTPTHPLLGLCAAVIKIGEHIIMWPAEEAEDTQQHSERNTTSNWEICIYFKVHRQRPRRLLLNGRPGTDDGGRPGHGYVATLARRRVWGRWYKRTCSLQEHAPTRRRRRIHTWTDIASPPAE